ncbi:MAG: S66 peptidase family protein [Actinomycetes bacterium]
MTGPPLTALPRPRRLVPGDTVAIVATSGPLDADRLRRGVALLESWGLRVRVGRRALRTDPAAPFLAGTDDERAADLQEAWCDPSVAAVLVARGGSGVTRLLDRLDWPAMRAAGPRLLVGFSDVTALHEAVAWHLGLASLFGPMPASAAFGEVPPEAATVDHLRRTLFEPESVQVIGGATCVSPGRTRGVLVGGTLSLLASTVGTAQSRPANGGIVVLEDVGEVPYRLDNKLTQLLRTGWFEGARGVVLGSWTDCGDAAADLVAGRLRHLGLPMMAGLPFGHCAPQLTIPLGVEADLDSATGTLTLVEPALS